MAREYSIKDKLEEMILIGASRLITLARAAITGSTKKFSFTPIVGQFSTPIDIHGCGVASAFNVDALWFGHFL